MWILSFFSRLVALWCGCIGWKLCDLYIELPVWIADSYYYIVQKAHSSLVREEFFCWISDAVVKRMNTLWWPIIIADLLCKKAPQSLFREKEHCFSLIKWLMHFSSQPYECECLFSVSWNITHHIGLLVSNAWLMYGDCGTAFYCMYLSTDKCGDHPAVDRYVRPSDNERQPPVSEIRRAKYGDVRTGTRGGETSAAADCTGGAGEDRDNEVGAAEVGSGASGGQVASGTAGQDASWTACCTGIVSLCL